jgi:geranylgeranyl reductase family protein
MLIRAIDGSQAVYHMYDVAVIGGGPAGSTSALRLAETGAKVVLLEKREFPRYKTCGGGIVQRTRKLLNIDITPVVEREFCSASVTLLQRNARFEITRNDPLISMTMRSSFDTLLVCEAEKAGAQIRPRSRVLSMRTGKDHVSLETSDGHTRAHFVVIADGANSVTASAAGWKDARVLAPAMECELYLTDREMARFGETVRFDFDLGHAGYGWVFPKRGHLSAGVVSIGRRNGSMRQTLSRYLAGLGIAHVQKEERHGFVIPLTPRKDGFARERFLLTGDAAGFADPVTAEGISSAILSGSLAAQALLEERFHALRTGSRYEALVRERILPDLSAARKLSRILYGSSALGSWAFIHYGDRFVRAVSEVFTGEKSYRSVWSVTHYLRLMQEYLRSVPRGRGG